MLAAFYYSTICRHIGFAPTAEQASAIRTFADFALDRNERVVMILRGSAGTGKTTLAGAIVKALVEMKQKLVLMAPTGRAAKVFSSYSGHSAYTIHRKIYQSRRYDPQDMHFSLARNPHKDTIFFVDEASMIANSSSEGAVFGTGCLLDDLITYVYSGERCRLVLLGDVAQLPPGGYTTSPALACSTLRSYSLTVYELSLTDTARQRKDSGILANATLLRRILPSGHPTAPPPEVSAYPDVEVVGGDTLAESVEHCYATDGTDATIIITRSNRRAVMFNQGIRARVLYMEAEITTGDMLLVAKNNYFWAEGYDQIDFIANGDVAVVRRISEVTTLYGFRFADVTLEFPDYQVELDAKILLDALYAEAPALTRDENERLYQNVMADYADVSRKSERYRLMKQNPFFNALQVKFAYSVTCHKAQGGQWKNVFIDMGYIPEDAYSNVDFYRWLYTSFTRATRHIYLINPPLAVK